MAEVLKPLAFKAGATRLMKFDRLMPSGKPPWLNVALMMPPALPEMGRFKLLFGRRRFELTVEVSASSLNGFSLSDPPT
ncbi:MAG: hypothetical protein ABJ246_22545 [Paracoccaceae bacterium]